jgi:cobalt-zinc-cadmium efflux system membrane fusion protein
MKRTLLFFLMLTLFVNGCGPKKTEETDKKEETVHLSEEQQKLIDLKIEKVKKAPFESRIQVIGEIAQETEKAVHLTSPEAGVLKAFLKEIGEPVQKNEPLFEVTTRQGQTIQIPAPDHGIILAKYIKEGESVDSITSVMTIVNPDELRASFNVYEKDIARIKLGQKVIVKSVAYPDREFQGIVAFISPSVDDKTRTIRIRVNVDNKEDLLKFGMFVAGDIIETSDELVLLLPKNAVVSIEDKPAVFVPADQEEFALKFVKAGRSTGDFVEIKEGLKEDENVVTQGSFQLKSEFLKSTFGED